MPTMREESRKEFTARNTMEDLQCGALQRIADATEKMALRHTELIDKSTRLQRDVNFWSQRSNDRDRTISNLRGQITKLKKKLAVQP